MFPAPLMLLTAPGDRSLHCWDIVYRIPPKDINSDARFHTSSLPTGLQWEYHLVLEIPCVPDAAPSLRNEGCRWLSAHTHHALTREGLEGQRPATPSIDLTLRLPIPKANLKAWAAPVGPDLSWKAPKMSFRVCCQVPDGGETQLLWKALALTQDGWSFRGSVCQQLP